MAESSSSGLQLEHDSRFLPEIWAWFIIGLTAILLRYVVRLRTVGIRGFKGDDYITFLTLIFYTMDAVLVNLVYYTGANAGLTNEVVDKLSESEIQTLVDGSKFELAAWYSYTALIWCMKFTMLFFYKRLTMGTRQNQIIRYLFWLCGVTYAAVFLTITFGCHPFEDNWRVKPVPSKTCSFKPQNFLVTVTLNVITDAIILVIPIPMLWHLKINWQRKVIVAVFLSSGVFVITAALIRAVLTLGSAPSALNINRWGVRETIIGLLTVTLPILRPLFTRAFWRLGPYVPPSGAGDASHWSSNRRTVGGGGRAGAFELGSTSGESKQGASVSVEERSGSEDHIVHDQNLQVVMVHQTYDIKTSSRDEEASVGLSAEVAAGGMWAGPGGMEYKYQVTSGGRL